MKLRKLLALAMAAVLAVSSASVAVADDVSVGESGDLATAISSASNGDTITLTGDVALDQPITITKDLIIKGGKGGSITNTENVKSLFLIQGDAEVKFDGVTINTASNHAIQAYGEDARLLVANSTINGGAFTSILVNGGAYAKLHNSTFNSNGYATVEYGVGDGVTTLPEIELSGNQQVELYVDAGTIKNIQANVPGYQDMKVGEIAEEIQKTVKGATWNVTIPEGQKTTVSDWNGLKSAVDEGKWDTIEVSGAITVPAKATLDGNGEKIVLTSELKNGAFITMGEGATLKNLVIDTDGNAKHGVQFYNVNGGTLDNVTIHGGYYTSIIVNGSTNIEIKDCTTNPDEGAYANIEYAMGENVTQVPSLTISNLTQIADLPAVYMDQNTLKRVKANTPALSGATDEEVFEYIKDKMIDGITNGIWSPAGDTLPDEPQPTPDRDSDNDDGGDYFGNETWDEVKDQIAEAEEGDTIKVSATGLPYFPSSVARALKGKDITLEIRKNGVTYEVNGLEIGDIDKIWYEFDELETELLTADADSEAPAAEDEDKDNPDTGR